MEVTGGSLDVVVGPDGTPRSMTVAMVANYGGSALTSQLTYTFDPGVVVQTVTVPSDVWVLEDPGRGYSVWIPQGWVSSIDPRADFFDQYYDPMVTRAALSVSCLNSGETLSEWTKATRDQLVKQYGTKPSKTYDGTLGTLDAKFMEWAHVSIGGVATFVINVSTVRDGYGCDVRWYNDPGTENQDRQTLAIMNATFILH